jgi:RNA polymerase sigma factor (sigma-70 family)
MTLSSEDLTLTAGVAAGDQEAADLFARKYRPRLILVARRRNVPAGECEDVAHEALLSAINQLRRGLFRGDSSLGTWLERILAGKIADYWRRFSERPALECTLSSGDDSAAPSRQLVFAPEDQLVRAMVREGLSRMPARHRHVLLLNQRDGYTTKEIGLQLGLPDGTVGRVLAEAKQIFRKLIAGGEESGGH